jgi:Carboxypeptidase regulatory-like domain
MRKFASIGLIIALAMAGAPSGAFAASQGATQSAAVAGTVRRANMRVVPNANVQIRNVETGEVTDRSTTDDTGAFAFAGLAPGNYVVEVVDAAGKVLGIGTPFSLTAGATASASVILPGSGTAAAAATGGGFSLFGLGPVSSLAVLGAASAAAVTAVVATRPDASPSK